MHIVPAIQNDLEAIGELLIRNALQAEDLRDDHVQLFVAKNSGKVIGVAGMEVYEKTAFFRSFAVEDAWKGRGIGRKLLEHLTDLCMSANILDIYLLTFTAEKYFERHGFMTIPREQAPEAIRHTREFSTICPVSAVLMKKEL